MADHKVPKARLADLMRWEAYKHFFHITIFRYLVLWFSMVPVLASLLQGLPKPLIIPIGDRSISIALGLPFNWQLLWIASLFFFIALVIYQIRCPGFIKKYNNYGEYKNYGHDHRWLAWEARELVREQQGIARFVERLTTKGYLVEDPTDYSGSENPVVEKEQTKLYFRHATRNYVFAMPPNGVDSEGAERGIFWELFSRYSGSRLGSRITIVVLLSFSVACFSVVLIEHMWSGIQYVIDWLKALC